MRSHPRLRLPTANNFRLGTNYSITGRVVVGGGGGGGGGGSSSTRASPLLAVAGC
jgi:hypothetical protein